MTKIEWIQDERVAALESEIERLQELLRGVGANRYWEGRWRDAQAEIDHLRNLCADLVDLVEEMPVKHPQQSTRRNILVGQFKMFVNSR